jgi:hypothetical protein
MTDTKDDLVHKAGALLLQDPEIKGSDWTGVSVVFETSDGRNYSVGGYVYTTDDWNGFSPEEDEAFSELMFKLREHESADGQPPFIACLLQISRSDMKTEIAFEYEDANRWKVTPRNLDRMVAEMRPANA